jgi:hypothetical protein
VNGGSPAATIKTITSVTTIGEEDQSIFDRVAKQFMVDSFYHRSANGRHSPRRSPIKIKRKIITKPKKPIHPHKLRIWLANHQIAMRKCDGRKKAGKTMNEANFALMGPITRKCCSRRSIHMYLLSQYLHKQKMKREDAVAKYEQKMVHFTKSHMRHLKLMRCIEDFSRPATSFDQHSSTL